MITRPAHDKTPNLARLSYTVALGEDCTCTYFNSPISLTIRAPDSHLTEQPSCIYSVCSIQMMYSGANLVMTGGEIFSAYRNTKGFSVLPNTANV